MIPEDEIKLILTAEQDVDGYSTQFLGVIYMLLNMTFGKSSFTNK